MKKLLAESLGICFFLLVAWLAPKETAPFAGGLILAAWMYVAQPLSGAHFNPAVSLALLMQGKLTRDEFPGYFLAQLAGAAGAAVLAGFLIACTDHPVVGMHTNRLFCSAPAEFLGTFMFVFIWMRASGSGHWAWMMGATYTALTLALGSISGAFFNPAAAFGAAIMGLAAWSDLLMYLVCSLLGAAAAATVTRLLEESPMG